MTKDTLLKDLFKAYYDARRNKRGTLNALKFEINYEHKLFELCEEIRERKYKLSPSICFIGGQSVRREIFAANFRDRIVHHLIFNYINPIFEKKFIYDSYSCRIGKGTSFGIKRVDHFIRSASENYQKDCWIFKLDIKGYFMAIDRKILFEKIERRLRTLKNVDFDIDLILYLIRKVVFNDPTKNCRVKGKREDWVGLPKSKSLFFSGKDKGFPIGNLTSQLFGNIYLDEFDHFAREQLGIKRYGRYVDDMVFIHDDKEYLKKVIEKVETHLRASLGLTLHPKKIYLQHFSKGVSFLGVYIKPFRIYTGKRIKDNFYKNIFKINTILKEKNKLDRNNYFHVFASVNSYLGTMKHYQTFRLRKKFLSLLNLKFWEYFSIEEKNLQKLEKLFYLSENGLFINKVGH